MRDQDVDDLLDRIVANTPVAPAPLAAIRDAAGRARRRRTAVLLGGVVAAVTVIGGVAGTLSGVLPMNEPLPTDSPTTVSPPSGHRWVGMGHAVIAVPDQWATNRAACGTPMADTVVIDQTVIEGCAIGRPDGVASVELVDSAEVPELPDFGDTQHIEIDGVTALRVATTCTQIDAGRELCQAGVYIPTQHALFKVDSEDRAEVATLMDSIRVLPGQVAVPGASLGFVSAANSNSSAEFIDAIRRLGLAVEIIEQPTPDVSTPEGTTLDVSPGAGTVLNQGDTVKVTVSTPPRTGPDEDPAAIAWGQAGGRPQMLTYDQLSTNPTVRMEVGDLFRAYPEESGEHPITLMVNDSTFAKIGPTVLEALRTGDATITITTADCATTAAQQGCRGGISLLEPIQVIVQPRT